MNRGDFSHTHLPKTFRIAAVGKYQALNGFVPQSGPAGSALGTFVGAAPVALNIAIPADVMTQLTNEHLVTPTAINLYDDALDPSLSAANLKRYLSLLERLAGAAVDDGP